MFVDIVVKKNGEAIDGETVNLPPFWPFSYF
jgi:hypothetical protein